MKKTGSTEKIERMSVEYMTAFSPLDGKIGFWHVWAVDP
jgi:hypothetical protein